jgi:hypothetical protein
VSEGVGSPDQQQAETHTKEHDMNTTTTQIPAERITPGVGRQIINAYNADGTFLRQVRHYGTERQARAYVLLQGMHDTDPGFQIALAALRGEE